MIFFSFSRILAWRGMARPDIYTMAIRSHAPAPPAMLNCWGQRYPASTRRRLPRSRLLHLCFLPPSLYCFYRLRHACTDACIYAGSTAVMMLAPEVKASPLPPRRK